MRLPLMAGCLLAAACMACETPAAIPHPRASHEAVPAPAPPGGLVPAADLAPMREPVDTTVTLGRWLEAHPGDRLGNDVPEGANEDRICRLAEGTVSVAGHAMRRTAVFDLPDPPAGEALPDTTKLAEHLCTLSAVWLVSSEPDQPRAIAFADSVARTLAASLGDGMSGVRMRGFGTANWLDGRSWTTAAGTLALGVIPASERRTPTPSSTTSIVSLTAYAPRSDLADRTHAAPRDSTTLEDDVELANADSALSWTSPDLAAALAPVLARVKRKDGPARTAASDSDLVRAVRAVHAAAPSLDPPRRAAALYALDAVLWRSASRFNMDDSGHIRDPLLPALRAAGAGYREASLDEEAGNDRADLRAAWDADSLSPGGHAALLALLRNGWYTGPACGQDFEPVIAHGESAFRRGERNPLAHYAVGNAWGDIVSLAQGGGRDYVDASEYLPRAREARQRAIEHYRLALAGLTDTGLRRDAWRSAVALMLGKTTGTRYFCIYD